jgi:tRNA threonylcarbamoyladenosine biosynthesis protein TsaE
MSIAMAAAAFLAHDDEQTRQLGARLARAMPDVSQRAIVLYLRGELGSGKTTLVQGFLSARGITGQIRSPTYALVELYETSIHTYVHLDLYRLRHSDELVGLGLRDWDAPGHVWLIEWPQRAVAGQLPAADLYLELSVEQQAHRVELRSASPTGQRWVQSLGPLELPLSAP